jgi:hypothetical protein
VRAGGFADFGQNYGFFAWWIVVLSVVRVERSMVGFVVARMRRYFEGF